MPQDEPSQQKNYYKCVMPQCRKRRFDIAHRFPRPIDRQEEWLRALRQPSLRRLTPKKRMEGVYVCARHFRPEDYVRESARVLNKMAVPSLNIRDLSELRLCKRVLSIKMSGSYVPRWEKDWDEEEFLKQRNKQLEEAMAAMREKSVIASSSTSVRSSCRRRATREGGHRNMEGIAGGERSRDGVKEKRAEERATVEEDSGDPLQSGGEEHLEAESMLFETPTEMVAKTNLNTGENIIFRELEVGLFDNDAVEEAEVETAAETPQSEDEQMAERLGQTVVTIEPSQEEDHNNAVYTMKDHYAQQNALEYTPLSYYKLWSAQDVNTLDDLQPISFNELICDADKIHSALKILKRYGILLIDGCPSTETPPAQRDSTLHELLLHRLFPQLPPYLPKESRSEFNVFTQFQPHTNCTFESVDCGLQVISLAPRSVPVKLMLVDGYSAACELSVEDFDILSDFKQNLIYQQGKNLSYQMEALLFQSCGEFVERIHYAPYQLRPLCRNKEFGLYFEAAKKFGMLLRREEQQWRMMLKPDMLVILDNWRICWQAMKTDRTSERKGVLDFIYITRKHFDSRLQNLQKSRSEFEPE